jgi:phosphatidylinositol-bisphosphatase
MMTPTDGGGASISEHSVSEPVDVEQELSNHATQFSLSRAVHARRDEYIRPHRIRVKVGSWNVAACPGTDKDLASWFVDGKGLEPQFDKNLASLNLNKRHPDDGLKPRSDGGDGDDDAQGSDVPVSDDKGQDNTSIRIMGGSDVGLYVLGLQEIISLNVIAQYADTSASAKWIAALEAAMPPQYKLITSQQLSGLLILIYASPEVADTIADVSTVSVGTGLMGYMGNKGGISARLVLGEATRLVFTNCHLASGHDQTNLDRRSWDYNKILSQTRFAPAKHAGIPEDEGQGLGDEDFGFWFGDLNYRLDGLPGDDIRRLLMLHTKGEYDVSKKGRASKLEGEQGVIVMNNHDDESASAGTRTPDTISRETSFDELDDDDEATDLPDPDDFVPDADNDPASLQATLNSLLPHDQLQRHIKDRKAFHEGWREGAITFLPSYKYDIGTVGLFDSSEKRRAPSWCDRILYRTRQDVAEHKQKLIDEVEAKKKDEDMKQRGIDTAADDESVLFDYDPDKDQESEPNNEAGYDYDEYDEGDDQTALNEADFAAREQNFKDRVKLNVYTTHQRITSSDHKPIVALFTLDYDAVVPELKAKVHAEVAREFDRAENEGRPVVTIVVEKGEAAERDVTDGSGGVDFGEVSFMERKQRSMTIANTGSGPASFCFVEKPGTSKEAANGRTKTGEPAWLKIELDPAPNSEGPDGTKAITLEPGETASALITLSVTSLAHTSSLNAGTASLEEVLVLRVIDGRDHFITARAAWQPSCFGRSIGELIRVPSRSGGVCGFIKALAGEPNGTHDDGHPGWKNKSIPDSCDIHASSPTELYRLTEAIETLAERVVADANMLADESAHIPRDVAGWPFVLPDSFESPDADSSLHGKQCEDHSHLVTLIRALDLGHPHNPLDALPADLLAVKRLEIAAQVFTLFMYSLTDGVINESLFSKIEAALPSLSPTTSTSKAGRAIEDDKNVVLDILSGAPYQNISFVFVTSMLARVAAEVAPLTRAELDALNAEVRSKRASVRGFGALRRVKTGSDSSASRGIEGVDERNIQRRLAWEKKAADVLGPALCRLPGGGNGLSDKQRKTSEDRMKGLVDIFLRRRDGV